MHIVLDTNVLVSGMISARGAPGRIVDLLREGVLELVVDDRVLDEYARVLNRPYFRRWFTQAECDDVICYLQSCSLRVVPVHQVQGLPDASDAAFAETALTAGVPLVTGNGRHFPKRLCRGIVVQSPAEFAAGLL